MNKKKTKDENLLAKGVIDDIIKLTESETFEHTPEKNPAAVYLGRKGGLIGGKARAAKLSVEEKSRIARKAANARWNKQRNGTK